MNLIANLWREPKIGVIVRNPSKLKDFDFMTKYTVSKQDMQFNKNGNKILNILLIRSEKMLVA